MAVTYETDTEHDQSTNSATWTITKPSGVASGDLLITLLASANEARSITSPPSGWTVIETTVLPITISPEFITAYWKIAGGSEPANYAWGWDASTGNGGAAVILRYSGADQTTPIDNHRYDEVDAISNVTTSGSITPSVDNCLVFSFISSDKGATPTPPMWTPPGGWTERFDFEGTLQDMFVGGAEIQQTTATSVSIAWTNAPSAANPGQIILFAIRPAVVAGAGVSVLLLGGL